MRGNYQKTDGKLRKIITIKKAIPLCKLMCSFILEHTNLFSRDSLYLCSINDCSLPGNCQWLCNYNDTNCTLAALHLHTYWGYFRGIDRCISLTMNYSLTVKEWNKQMRWAIGNSWLRILMERGNRVCSWKAVEGRRDGRGGKANAASRDCFAELDFPHWLINPGEIIHLRNP